MSTTAPLPIRHLTPDEVLAVLASLKVAADGPASVAAWTWDTPLYAAWFGEKTPRWFPGFSAGMSDVLDGLGEKFGISIEQNDFPLTWRDVKTKTLRDLCEFIAGRATIPVIDPPTPESALAAIREVLRQAGADVESLAPETPLEPYLRSYWKTFRTGIAVIGAGEIPEPRIEHVGKTMLCFSLPFLALFGGGLLAFFLTFLMSLCSLIQEPWISRLLAIFMVCVFVAVPGAMAVEFLSYRWGYSRPRLGEWNTFGELAEAIAGARQKFVHP